MEEERERGRRELRAKNCFGAEVEFLTTAAHHNQSVVNLSLLRIRLGSNATTIESRESAMPTFRSRQARIDSLDRSADLFYSSLRFHLLEYIVTSIREVERNESRDVNSRKKSRNCDS